MAKTDDVVVFPLVSPAVLFQSLFFHFFWFWSTNNIEDLQCCQQELHLFLPSSEILALKFLQLSKGSRHLLHSVARHDFSEKKISITIVRNKNFGIGIFWEIRITIEIVKNTLSWVTDGELQLYKENQTDEDTQTATGKGTAATVADGGNSRTGDARKADDCRSISGGATAGDTGEGDGSEQEERVRGEPRAGCVLRRLWRRWYNRIEKRDMCVYSENRTRRNDQKRRQNANVHNCQRQLAKSPKRSLTALQFARPQPGAPPLGPRRRLPSRTPLSGVAAPEPPAVRNQSERTQTSMHSAPSVLVRYSLGCFCLSGHIMSTTSSDAKQSKSSERNADKYEVNFSKKESPDEEEDVKK
ncbi:hypothetical protein LXL04_029522 [Taraxacum kok-saghyz]